MYRWIKRGFDFLFSAIAIVCLLPLFLPIVVTLKLTGEGEVFYRQIRMGMYKQPFGILKFATMLKDSLNIGSKTVTTRNDPRITKFGKWLRISKLNELPQLWNVLKGDMSFVGPRPLLINSFKKYEKNIQNTLSKIRPGITGIGSVVFRDEENLITEVRNLGGDPMEYYKNYIYPYKGALELYYSRNQSFGLDLIILFLTAWKIVFKNQELEYVLLRTLSPKPATLTIQGIKELYSDNKDQSRNDSKS